MSFQILTSSQSKLKSKNNSKYSNNYIHNQNKTSYFRQTLTNQEAYQIIKSGTIQPKLKISQPNDPYEIEADRVADQIMNMSISEDTEYTISDSEESLHRQCSKCSMHNSEDEEIKISRKSHTSVNMQISDDFTNQINNNTGKSLDSSIRSFMEPRFDYDFSDVMVHDGSRSNILARSVGAKAFTVGNNIYFEHEEYASDKRLMAHELTHVIQQENSPDKIIQRYCGNPSFCTPYDTVDEASSAEWWLRNIYLPGDETAFGIESRRLFEKYLSRSKGDDLSFIIFNNNSSYLVSSFKESGDTTDDMDNVIDLVYNRLDRIPDPPLQDNDRRTISLSNFLSRSEMNNRPINYRNPLSVAGHVAGGIGSSDAGADYRKITYANVVLEKTIIEGSRGYILVELIPNYEVFDAIDFCPGNCGSLLEELVTIPMSRLEASGEAYDVPYKVIFNPEPRFKKFWFP